MFTLPDFSMHPKCLADWIWANGPHRCHWRSHLMRSGWPSVVVSLWLAAKQVDYFEWCCLCKRYALRCCHCSYPAWRTCGSVVAVAVDSDGADSGADSDAVAADVREMGNWPTNWSGWATMSRWARHDPNRSNSMVDSSVLDDRRQLHCAHRRHEQHDCGCEPPRRYAQSGNVDRMDRNRCYGMYGIVLFCTWDGVASCAIRACHGRIDTFRHICIRRLPRMGDTIRSYIWKWTKIWIKSLLHSNIGEGGSILHLLHHL